MQTQNKRCEPTTKTMQIAYSLEEFIGQVPQGAVHAATIGNFDGVHQGHRELIRLTSGKAAKLRSRSVAVTFDPHPEHVLRKSEEPKLLTPLPRKLELLELAGMDAVLVLPFTRDMARMEPEHFVHEYLVKDLHIADLIIGYNFALGKERKGTFTTLCHMGNTWGFTVTRVQPVAVGGQAVSSTRIREQIRTGNVAEAASLLGRPHSIDGEVMHGEGRGAGLGFPTANVAYGNSLLPPAGAYATWVELLPYGNAVPCGGPYPAMTNVGTNPTFGGNGVTLETHLLNFSGNLYGRTMRVHIVERLREEIRFSGASALCEQLALDKRTAAEHLERNPMPSLALHRTAGGQQI